MKVLLAFTKFMPYIAKISDAFNSIAQLCSAYSSVSLVLVPCDGRGELLTFNVCARSNIFSEELIAADSQTLGDLFDFMDMSVSGQEYDRILETCRACVRVKKTFNYHDVFLYNVPFREPVEKSLFDTQTLFDTQAVILILRECLCREHRLLPALQTLHSRTTLATQLYDALSPFTQPVSACELVAMSSCPPNTQGSARVSDDGASVA